MIEGKISKILINSSPRIVLDAEPYVMSKVRKIFDNAQTYYEQGIYTHKPIHFSFNLNSCKDVVWIMSRYTLDIDEDLLKEIQDKCNEYDNIVKAIHDADKDSIYKISPNAIPLAFPLREYQVQFLNMFNKINRMLLGDVMGLGKTISAISTIQEPETRPAIIVVPTHLCTQWEREVHRFLPGITTHVIRGFKNYDLPQTDVLITSYNRLSPWQDVLINKNYKYNTVIFDEVHELRHTSTEKRLVAKDLSHKASRCLGLSGTPIYNHGGEIWSVLDVIKPGCLGRNDEFVSEWCDWGKVREPKVLNSFLKKQGLMLRRTTQDIGLKFGEASKQIITIDADLQKLKEIQDVAKMLALSVLSGNVKEDTDAARKFDYKMRQATGVAKARPVAEFVKMLLEEKEKIVLVGWHRECYLIWEEAFKGIKTVMYTGSETIKEKDKAVKEFIEGDAKIFIISLRSGSGLDGLQKICNTVVFGELDWSPHVMDQVVARLDRDGQKHHVQAYYLSVADGSDPYMINVLSAKRSQHDGLIEGKDSEGVLLEGGSSQDRIREMAASYLQSIGEDIPEVMEETGLLGELATLIRKFKLPNNTEEEMQVAMDKLLKDNVKNATVEREYKITKRSRLDFLIHDSNEKIAIECKIESTNRPEVYRQVRRYIKEGNITSLILVAPWYGISSFKVDGVSVIVIDTNVNQI